jgi:hypothetical protein
MKRRQFLQSLALLTTASAAIIGSNSADARRGRPASPTSVAGVSRRTPAVEGAAGYIET